MNFCWLQYVEQVRTQEEVVVDVPKDCAMTTAKSGLRTACESSGLKITLHVDRGQRKVYIRQIEEARKTLA